MMIKKTIMLFLSMTIAYSVHAINDSPQGIIVDGSLTGTTPIELTGPAYQIKAEYGRLEQSNLFHSFTQFNLHSGESAFFLDRRTFKMSSAGFQDKTFPGLMAESNPVFEARISIS
jgi:hypothetical protein